MYILFAASTGIKTMDQSSRDKAPDRKTKDSFIITLTLKSQEAITVISVKVKLLYVLDVCSTSYV